MKGKLAVLTAIFLLFCKGTYMNASDITTKTKIQDIISDPGLGDWGRLLFPVNAGYYSGDTLGDLQLTWYSHINPQKTVEIVRYMKEHMLSGEQVFFDIYSEAEKRADPEKQNTGLFFFRGKPGAKQPSAMRAAALPMLGQCTIPCLMHWSFQKKVTTHLL